MTGPATLLCLGFIAYAFWKEFERNDRERISWAPFVWMFFAGSRYASAWLNLRTPGGGVDAYAEGSPLDRTVFLMLIVWGALVLSRRDVNWRHLLTHNKLLTVYLLYCLSSIVWTDEPTILIKRWTKDLGNPIMALVLLTELRPYEAVATTVRRLAIVLLPLSVLFIRYYPELGRGYSVGGGTMYTGVSDQKNTLGLTCLIIGMCATWSLAVRHRQMSGSEWTLIGMLCWLLYMANSKTSLTCLIVAITLLACATRPSIVSRPIRLISITVTCAIGYVVADWLFSVQELLLYWLGRDATLTNRTQLWDVVSALQTNALVGTGFMSFWAGERMQKVWSALGPGVNQAHNGYLEQYLNLGYVGVLLVLVIAFNGVLSVRRHFGVDRAAAILRFSIIVVAMLYNYTEASFYGVNNMWVLFIVGVIAPLSGHQEAARREGAIGSRVGLAPRRALRVGFHVEPSIASGRPRRLQRVSRPLRFTTPR